MEHLWPWKFTIKKKIFFGKKKTIRVIRRWERISAKPPPDWLLKHFYLRYLKLLFNKGYFKMMSLRGNNTKFHKMIEYKVVILGKSDCILGGHLRFRFS